MAYLTSPRQRGSHDWRWVPRRLLLPLPIVLLACGAKTDIGAADESLWADDTLGDTSTGGASMGRTGRPDTPSPRPDGPIPQDPSLCLNGIVEDGEECDDGRESYFCDDDCTRAYCGDGLTNETRGESCDDAGETSTCNLDCTRADCGDGVLNVTAGEQCDDANTNDMDACRNDCQLAYCGDSLVSPAVGETCDAGGVETALCDLDCTFASCGDGVLNVTAGEQCDDGKNGDDNDGCTDECEHACENVALSATAFASSGGITPYSPDKINDGSLNGCSEDDSFSWIYNGTTPSGAYWELRWSAPVTIGSFFIDGKNQDECKPGRTIGGFTVQVFQNGTYQYVADLDGQEDYYYEFDNPVETTRLRIFDVYCAATSGQDTNSYMWEWEVYTATACAPAP